LGAENYLILMNFSGREVKLKTDFGTFMLSTYTGPGMDALRPFEGRLVRIN
jgi:hypothetical protein